MKTAVTVLQEMMVKMGQIPDYECISQSGPEHQATFEYRCAALGAVVTARARSKKEAKQEAARLMLRALAARGHSVPAPYGLHDLAPDEAGGGPSAGAVAALPGAEVDPAEPGAGGAGGSRNNVALLQELAAEYRLPGPEYALVSDTGPPHMRLFTVQARVGQRTASATATTKKMARQRAAEQLYAYLRENLARLTADFVEEEALVRAHERAMERYLETRDDMRRPDLGQKISDYHLEKDRCAESLRLVEEGGAESASEAALESALAALGLRAAGVQLAGGVHALRVEAHPVLAFAGTSPQAARTAALRYLRRALAQNPPADANLV